MLAMVGFLGAAGEAQAVYSIQRGSIITNGDGTFTWQYNASFTPSGNPFALNTGNGIIVPGSPGSQDFLTIYDIAGYVAGSAVAGGSHVLLTPTVLVGPNGPNTLPTDDANVVNLTFRYNGGTAATATVFTGFSFRSTIGTINSLGFYTSQSTNTGAGSKVGEIGRVELPTAAAPAAVPEPATLVTASLGAMVLVGGQILRRRAPLA